LAGAVPEIVARRVHICGPTEMTDPTRQMLRKLGVPEAEIRVESFASPSRAGASVPAPVSGKPADAAAPLAADYADAGQATVTFARSGKSCQMTAGQTVLEAAESLEVTISYDCRAGICGQCKTKLLAGHVVMDAQDALDAIDRANNVILSCQARCVDDVVVDA
jgi:glycine betaine catabolism B